MHPVQALFRAWGFDVCAAAERNDPESCCEQTWNKEDAQLATGSCQQNRWLFHRRTSTDGSVAMYRSQIPAMTSQRNGNG